MTTLSTPTIATAKLDAIATMVREGIASRRWFHLTEPLSEVELQAVLVQLGTVSRHMDVVVSADRERQQQLARRNKLPRPSAYQAAELGFHTDPPPADLLALYCVTQDEVDGASLLIDMGRIESDFTPEEVDDLCRIKIAYSFMNPEGFDELGTLNLVTRHPDGVTINYMPWGIRRPDELGLDDLLDRFEQYLRNQPIISIRLAPGECLFIDNGRMLHGRGALAPDSKRRLLRVHVNYGTD